MDMRLKISEKTSLEETKKQFQEMEKKKKTALEGKKWKETVEEMKKIRMCHWTVKQLDIFCAFTMQQQREFDEEHDKLNG